MRAQNSENSRARQEKRSFIEKEQMAKMKQKEDQMMADQQIVKSLYSLEVKLKVGQQRAHTYQDQNIRKPAQASNQKVQNIQEMQNTEFAQAQEQKELERFGKVVAKQQKMSDFQKFKQEEQQYISQNRIEKAQ